MPPRWIFVFLMSGLFAGSAGCTTNKRTDTARTAVEQLLISNAVDQSFDKVDFEPFRGRAIHIEEKYMDGVDKNYVLGSLRHRVLQSGGRLVAKADEADVVLEIRSGAIGTDNTESFVGIPEIVLPGMLTLPEIRLLTRTHQSGTAKIGLVAYEAKTGNVLGDGGAALARSDDSNWFIMGIGPHQSGSVRQEIEAKTSSRLGRSGGNSSTMVTFRSPGTRDESTGRFRLTSGQASDQRK
jgi:hypothetical protein